MRTAAPREVGRVTRFGADFAVGVDDAPHEQELIVPWDTVVVLPDVPLGGPAEVLTGIAQCSGNELVAIGYDLIPITSAETRPAHEPGAAGEWLVPLKSARRIAGISSSATTEFRGFAKMLAAQGLRGPKVEEVRLPAPKPRHGSLRGSACAAPPLESCYRERVNRTRTMTRSSTQPNAYGTREPTSNCVWSADTAGPTCT